MDRSESQADLEKSGEMVYIEPERTDSSNKDEGSEEPRDGTLTTSEEVDFHSKRQYEYN